MAVIFDKQNIGKRHKMTYSGHSIKSAGLDSGFMSHFSQKPVRIRRKSSDSILTSIKRPEKRKRPGQLLNERKRPEKRRGGDTLFARNPSPLRREEKAEKTQSSGFVFTVPSLGTLAVIAGIVVIALAAFNWEDFEINQPQNYAFMPSEDTEVEESTMRYAATGISSLMPSVNFVGQSNIVGQSNSVGQTAPQAPQNAEAAATATTAAAGTGEELYNDLTITFEWQEYRVRRGDSVSVIAQRFGVSIGAIIASNEIRNARALREGAVIRIPNIDGIPYTIKNGDSLSRIAASFNVPLEVILDVNDIKSDRITAGETLFIPGARMNDIDLRMSLGETFMYPIQGRFLTSRYGMRKDPISGAVNFHTGIDLRANTGTPVVASLDGVVSVVSENWLYGKHIIISHDNGYKTIYAHLNSFSVRLGDRVARGRKIGETGNTGYSTGPHLHFGIYDKNNRLVNPLDLLN